MNKTDNSTVSGFTPTSSEVKPVSDNVRYHLWTGIAGFLILVFGLGGWGATAELAGAVIASGTVVVDTNVKKIQHPTGGIVSEIRVRDGDKVAPGDVLLRLDDTITRANLQIIVRQLDELGVRKSRLVAERDNASSLIVPKEIEPRIEEEGLAEIVGGERVLFESRRTAREGQKSQLNERIQQLKNEIAGLEDQHKAKGEEIRLIGKELEGLKILKGKDLTTTNRLTALQREAARLKGEQSRLAAAAAQSRGKIAEIELQIIQIDQDLRTEVVKELRELQAKEAELIERRVAAEDQLRRIDIRSPLTGIIDQLSMHTVGGVIAPGEQIMLIVPQTDALVIEVKIAPRDIDNVTIGQPCFVRFTAFNQRTTPELAGEVTRVSPDLTKDPQTGAAYYVARVALSRGERKKLGDLKLKSGMPAEVQIRTPGRTALSYLMKPLTDQVARAFKEQ